MSIDLLKNLLKELYLQLRWGFVGWSNHIYHWWIYVAIVIGYLAGLASGWGLFGGKEKRDGEPD